MKRKLKLSVIVIFLCVTLTGSLGVQIFDQTLFCMSLRESLKEINNQITRLSKADLFFLMRLAVSNH